ncbi:hypothetical protein E2C01_071550 [Portunus trituberculatus]|uniref:Uncharacterized protein n=1 Tax=Portunus trituberculatus TaxID=210409 RepID=A0A5B7I4Q7_PORTR|nr:hypothetical protein [Portunus trituberculatus]
MTLPGYRVYQRNTDNEPMDGVAIAVRNRLVHRIEDDFDSETLAVTTQTTEGPLTIATTYLPPRRPHIPHHDFMRLLRRQTPVIIADTRHSGQGRLTPLDETLYNT